MNIPLNIVKKGEEVVNKYVELSNKENELTKKNIKDFYSYCDTLDDIQNAVYHFKNKSHYRKTPVFTDENKWDMPNLKEMNELTDTIWTYQKNIESILNNYISNVYEYIKVKEKLNNL